MSTRKAPARSSAPDATSSPVPGARAVLMAELWRNHRTATWGVPVAVVVFTLHALMVAHASHTASGWNDGVLPWLNPYPAAFALPMGALTGAMLAWRERRHRAGGTAWRATSPTLTAVARVVVLAASALVSQLLLLAPVVVDALVRGAGFGPWQQYLLFVLAMWVAVTGASVWGLALGQWLGGAAVGLAPAFALVWSAAGAVQAETPTWWMRPWTWAIRPTLPLLEVHGNGVALETGSPVWDYPVAPSVLGSALLCLAGVGVVLLGTRRAHLIRSGWLSRLLTRPTPVPQADDLTAPAHQAGPVLPATPADRADQAVPTHRPAPVMLPGPRNTFRAIALGLPWRVWTVLAVVLLGLLVLTRAIYSTSYSLPLFTLAGIPIAAYVAGATAWRAQSDAWRTLVLRARPGVLTAASLTWALVLLAAVLIPAWTVACWGAPLAQTDPRLGALTAPVYVFMVAPFVAFMLAALAHTLAQLAGTAVTISVGVGLFLVGLIIDGNEALVATPLWRFAPWGWTQVVGTYPQRWPLVAAASLAIGLMAFVVSAARGRAVATRHHD
ncbi:hypothetical protein [Actinomyces sp. MRS3W]|uniref:hypothetical protein n=1 Tax=Actinomyces sp. MRS3W TaxID=2800796 RepID=UPI0028FD8EAA|nr:hypothetical protein [Actinomyces sp. MRS3W]MDU0349004.1 hypothetical protein [Actinomyces sp. MRS3W]